MDLVEDLREAWRNKAHVTLALSSVCEMPEVSGRVERVAVTGTWALVSGVHVPLGEVLSWEVADEDR